MKISEYERVEKVDEFDLFLLEKMAGTKSVRLDDIYWSMMDSMSVENRRHVWRGKNLGAEFTGQQRASIKDGSFRGLFLGDYWENPEITTDYYGADNPIPIKWRIVDFDYGYNSIFPRTGGGFDYCTTHHITIMPDVLLKATDDGSAYGSTAYAGSTIRQNIISLTGKIRTLINTMFGFVTSGDPRITIWYKSIASGLDTNGVQNASVNATLSVELPSHSMIFGPSSPFFDSESSTFAIPSLYSNEQLAAFKMRLNYLLTVPKQPEKNSLSWWLQDSGGKVGTSSICFETINIAGQLSYVNGTNAAVGVRPMFCINGLD